MVPTPEYPAHLFIKSLVILSHIYVQRHQSAAAIVLSWNEDHCPNADPE